MATLEAPFEQDLRTRLSIFLHQRFDLLSLTNVGAFAGVSTSGNRAVCDWFDIVLFHEIYEFILDA